MKNKLENLVKIFNDGEMFIQSRFVTTAMRPTLEKLIKDGLVAKSGPGYSVTLAGNKLRVEDMLKNGGMTKPMESRYQRVLEEALVDVAFVETESKGSGPYMQAHIAAEIGDIMEWLAPETPAKKAFESIRLWLENEKEALPKRKKKWTMPYEELAELAVTLRLLAGELAGNDQADAESDKIGRIWKNYSADR